MADNWYIILELEFDPNPIRDLKVINDKIEEKLKFWSRNSNDFNKGPEYRRYIQLVPEIKKAMGDNAQQSAMIEEACRITFEPVDNLVKTIGRKGEITQDEINKIAAKLKLTQELVKKRTLKAGIKIGSSASVNYQAVYDKYYAVKPENTDVFNGMNSILKSFGAENLYDFLYSGTTTKNANNLSPDNLRQRSSERKKNDFYKNNSESGNGTKLCAMCDKAFADDKSKKIYDEYLEYCRRKSILDSMKSVAEIAGEISVEQGENYIGQLTGVFKDRKLSEEVLTAFCKIEKIIYITGAAKEGITNKANIKICRCGCTNNTDDGRKVCRECGLELIIKCPKCGVENESSIKVCKCGFKFENIDKAIALFEIAEDEIKNLDFAAARHHLEEAGKLWQGSPRLMELTQSLAEVEKKIASLLTVMENGIKTKRYFEAKKSYGDIKKILPNFKKESMEEEMNTAVSSAEAFFKKAKSSSNENEIIENCSKAYELCLDFPGISELIAKFPPKMPENLNITADGNTKNNILTWDKSQSSGMVFYTVLRKKDAAPQNNTDGDFICRISTSSYNDDKILPGVCYFYAVFAQRAGVFSNPALNSEPAINLFEITNVVLEQQDSKIIIKWKTVPSGSAVEIYRRDETGKESKLTGLIPNQAEYTDSGLVNDKSYSYKICLSYSVNGHKKSTPGLVLSGSPVKMPKPIDTLQIKQMNQDVFSAVWENSENSAVTLYWSNKKPEFETGQIIPLSLLETKMKRLDVAKSTPGSASFTYRDESIIYINAVIEKSGAALIGSFSRAGKAGTVVIKNAIKANTKIHISIEPPKAGITGFVVLYGFDKFAKDISDIKTVRKYIPLKQYQYDSALVIDKIEPKNYYFSVFAESEGDGEKEYSTSSEYLFINAEKETVTYSIDISKKLFGENQIIITFETTAAELPDIDINYSIGNAPVYKNSSKLFYEIKSQVISGKIQVKIPMKKDISKNAFIKAFLNNESMPYVLKLNTNSNYKIT